MFGWGFEWCERRVIVLLWIEWIEYGVCGGRLFKDMVVVVFYVLYSFCGSGYCEFFDVGCFGVCKLFVDVFVVWWYIFDVFVGFGVVVVWKLLWFDFWCEWCF